MRTVSTGKALVASFVIIAALMLAGCATPEQVTMPDGSSRSHFIIAPDDVEWGAGPESLPADARAAALAGDPSAAGPFTLRLDMPAGYSIPPHTHGKVERVTILSGTGHLGVGSDEDRGSATALPAGTYVEIAPGTVHYFFTEDEPVELQLHGDGPWGIAYMNDEDDPRNAPSP